MTASELQAFEDLKSQVNALQFALDERDLEVSRQAQENTDLKVTNRYLEEQLTWFQKQLFGKKSERIVSSDSQQLEFEGFELQQKAEEKTKTVPSHERRAPKRNGQDAIQLNPNLPVQTVILDVPEEEKVCKETGEPLQKIGEEISHKLAYTPGSYYIKKIVRPKYAHPQKPEAGVTTALLPEAILMKCQADNSLLAAIIVQKFANHMPLYRLAEQMERDGVGISRKLLSQWVIRCAEALKLLYEVMVQKILASENVFIDESPVKLQAKGKCDTAYMWVMSGGRAKDPPYRIYNFRKNRCHDHVWDLLNGYRGVLHSDKYGAYQRLAEEKKIVWCPCMSHIRRKFVEGEGGDPSFCAWVLRKIRYLFLLERVAWNRSPEERLRIRQEKEVPILDELMQKIKARLIEGKILPKSKFREAIGYFMGLAPYLKNYTLHAFARLDNNVAERAVRPLAIGRKNWLFFGSEDGGEAGAILLSFVQTCRGLGINPYLYLEDLFRRLMSHPVSRLEELLPDQWLVAKMAAQ